MVLQEISSGEMLPDNDFHAVMRQCSNDSELIMPVVKHSSLEFRKADPLPELKITSSRIWVCCWYMDGIWMVYGWYMDGMIIDPLWMVY